MDNRDWQKPSLPIFNGKTSFSPGTQHLGLENRKIFFMESVVKAWHRLSWAGVKGYHSWRDLRHVDVMLEDMA